MPAVEGKSPNCWEDGAGQGCWASLCSTLGGLDLMIPETSFWPRFLLTSQEGLKKIHQTWHHFSSELQGQHAHSALQRAVDAAHVQRLGAQWVYVMLGAAAGSSTPTNSLACIVRPDWWQEACWSPCWITLVLQQDEVLCKPHTQGHLTQTATALPKGPCMAVVPSILVLLSWRYPSEATQQDLPTLMNLQRQN